MARWIAPEGWSFVMVNPQRFGLVVRWLATHSRRPMLAMQLWPHMLACVDPRTGEVQASRAALAAEIGCPASSVTEITADLERIGAIRRVHAEGRVRYFLNPLIGTSLTGEERKRAQAAAPELNVEPPPSVAA